MVNIKDFDYHDLYDFVHTYNYEIIFKEDGLLVNLIENKKSFFFDFKTYIIKQNNRTNGRI